MNSHEVDYEVFGDDMQIVEVELDPGETVIAEAGAMNYMEEGITFEAKMGDGSEPQQGFMQKMISAAGRSLTGESIFTSLTTDSEKDASLSPPLIPERLFRWISLKSAVR